MKSIPIPNQSPYVLNILSKFREIDQVDAEKANRIRVDAQLEAQRKFDILAEQSKSFRETQFENMRQELLSECPELSKQELLNQQISNFKADLALKDQSLARERDEINKAVFESLEDNNKNFTNLIAEEYGNRGLSSEKFEQIKNDPKQSIPQEFVYLAASTNIEQSGIGNRQQINWLKALEPKDSDGIQKVRQFVRLVDDESKVTLNARLIDKDSPNPFYLLEGIYTPPNAAPGGIPRVMAQFRDFLIHTGLEAVVANNEYNLRIGKVFLDQGFEVSADGKEVTFHGLLERPHRAEMLEALKMMVQENVGIVSLGKKELEGSSYEYFAVTAVDGVPSPTSGRTLLNYEDLFRIKSGPDGVDIKHQMESRCGNEVLALGLNRRGLIADVETTMMLCAAEEGLGLENTWTLKVDLASGLKGGRFDRALVNEELRSGLAPLGIAALHPKGPNGYESAELQTARVGCAPVTTPNLHPEMGVNESPKVEPETARRVVPPPLPKTRRSALDEVDQPEEKDKKEAKSKAKRVKKDDREMEPGV